MKKRSVLPLTLCVALMFGLLSNLFAGAAYAKESRAAIVVSVKGTVMVMKAGGSTEYRAFEEMSLNQGDHIRTEDGASVVLRVVDQEDEVTIGPNTEMYISSLVEDDGGKKSKLKVWTGSLWFKVKKLVNADDQFEVETPTAVMGVRGSNGYIETKFGQLFALMASGILESSPTNGDGGASGSANIYPGQQYMQTDDQSGDPSNNVTPFDIKSFVQNASPDIIAALLTTIQEIREENEQFVQQMQDGSKQVDSKTGLVLDSPEVQQQFGGNLMNLLANIAKEAKDSGKLPADQVNSLVERANANTTGERIDLNNVKPFDTSVGMDPDVLKAKEEQMQKMKQDRESARERALQEQRDRAAQNPGLIDRLQAERERLKQENDNARAQEQQRANNAFLNGLSPEERARFEQDRQQRDNDRANQQQQNNSGTPGANAGGAPGGNTGGAGSGEDPGSDDDGGVGGGSTPDTTPPALIIAHPVVEPYTVRTAAQEIAVNAEQGASVRLYQGQAANPVATKTGLGTNERVSFEVNLAEGSNTFRVTATDAAGNVTTKTVTYILDTTAPELTVSHPSSEVAYVNEKLQSIVLTAEQGSVVNLYKGAATGTPLQTAAGQGAASVTFTLNDLDEGTNTYTVTATDTAGNVTTKTVTYVYVTTGPALAIVHPNPDIAVHYVNSDIQSIQAQVEEGITVRLFKGTNPNPVATLQGTGSAPVEFANLALVEGLNSYTVTASDASGNETSRTVQYELDTITPVLSVSHPLLTGTNNVNTINSKQQYITVQAEQGAAVSLYKGEGTVPLQSYTAVNGTDIVFNLNDLLTEGSNTFYVRATDRANNVTSITVQYLLDTGKPASPVLLSTAVTFGSGASQQFSVKAENGVTIRLINPANDTIVGIGTGAGLGANDSAVTIPFNLPDGTYNLILVAIDSAYNVSDATTISNVLIDTVRPGASFTIQGGGETTTRDVTLSITAQDNPVQMIVSESSTFAGASWEPFAATKTFQLSDGDGLKHIYMKVKDAAGNESATEIKQSVTMKRPTVALKAKLDGVYVETSVNSPLVLNYSSDFELDVVMNQFSEGFYAVELHLAYDEGLYINDYDFEDKDGQYVFEGTQSESVVGITGTDTGDALTHHLTYVITNYATDENDPSNVTPIANEKKLVTFDVGGYNESLSPFNGTIRIVDIIVVKKNGERINGILKGQPIPYTVTGGGA